MNKMKEVAELLGVQMNEKFKIKGFAPIYRITKRGIEYFSLYSKEWDETYSETLINLLKGTLEIQKSILDKKEKEFLEYMLKPFKNRVKSIMKISDDDAREEYIDVTLFNLETMCFPEFDKGTMYKGMEADKEYTLKDLGLFDE